MLTNSRVENWYRLDAAEQLLELGEVDGLYELAHSIVAGPEQSSQVIERAGELWFELGGQNSAEDVRNAVASKKEAIAWSLKGLAATLLLFGLACEVPPFARRLFNESADDEEINELIDFWIDSAGSDAADQIVEIMRDHPAWNSDERPSVARRLLSRGFNMQAAELIRMSLAASPVTRFNLNRELGFLIEALGAEAGPETLAWCEKLQANPNEYAAVMNHLIRAEASPNSILPLAQKVLYHPGSGNQAFVTAAKALCQRDPQQGSTTVLEALRLRPYGGAALRSLLLPVLAKQGEFAAVSELAQKLLSDPGVTTPELSAVIEAWLATMGRGAIREIMSRIEASIPLTVEQVTAMATLLTNEGFPDEAVRLWCDVCTTPRTTPQTRWRALQNIMDMGANRQADQAIREALVAPPSPGEALMLRRLLAWLTASH
ncbi:hypothetical protein O1L55_28335 [Streptomyces albulus]|nr:hypothetical protein [Streptomyces noursei]